MSLSKVLREIKKNIRIEDSVLKELDKKTKEMVSLISESIRKNGFRAEVFIGGSFAKGTLEKKKEYDIDIFVRFYPLNENLSDNLEKIVLKLKKKFKVEKRHGSRDYFRLIDGNIVFEVIPVVKIKKPKEAQNVTDLSYFHVNYVKEKIKERGLAEEIMLAKRFCRAQKVYGAESYIQGFSGYALECLIIYYGSFTKMLREMIKIKNGERLVIDPEKKFKRKNDVFFEMNESKLQSPVILVDPTWRERNVLAGLGKETFEKFQKRAEEFLKKPWKEFFSEKEIEIKNLEKEAQKKKAEFVHLKIKTDKDEGDVAGTKMRKFSRLLANELRTYFDVLGKEFDYKGGQEAEFYLIVRPKKEVIKLGPPVKMEKNASEFRKRNKEVFEKEGYLHSRIKVDFSASDFLKDYIRKYSEKIKEMDIVKIKTCN